MHITVITAVYPPYASGMALVAQEYVEAAVSAGHTVSVCTPRYAQSTFPVSSRVEVIALTPIATYGNAAWCPSLSAIPSHTDLVHLHYPAIGLVRALAKWHAKNPAVPIITTYHMDLVAPGLKGLFFRKYNRFAIATMTHFTKVLHVTSREYAETGLLAGCVLPPTREIPLSVDGDRFVPLPLQEKKDFFLFVGALDAAHAFKGIEVLLKATQQNSTMKCVIIGDGDMRQRYEALAIQAGISDRVTLKGFVSAEELPSWYARAIALILPSTSRSEAFGRVLLEAQACGTPVIASDLPGVRGAVDPNSGILVQPGSAVELSQACEKMHGRSAQEHERAGVSCRAFILAHFSASRVHAQLLSLYDTLILDKQ